jgi:hypothetical protein
MILKVIRKEDIIRTRTRAKDIIRTRARATTKVVLTPCSPRLPHRGVGVITLPIPKKEVLLLMGRIWREVRYNDVFGFKPI